MGVRLPLSPFWIASVDLKKIEILRIMVKKVNWIVALVMSVIFGSLGVDRFILGHVGLGLLKLFTLGGFGVWWLVDVILIATKYKFKNIKWE